MELESKASLGFKKQKPSEKPTTGTGIINALTTATQPKENSEESPFPDLPVSIANLQTTNDALADAVAAAATGSHIAKATVKTAVKNWNKNFTLTANYVTMVAQGDVALIRLAGFTPTKSESTPAQKPGALKGFAATINGSKGAIIAGSSKALPGVCTYLYTAVPDGVTITYNGNTMIITAGDKCIYIVADTRKQTELCNLPSGVPYNVSAFGVNRAGSGPAATSQQVIPQ